MSKENIGPTPGPWHITEAYGPDKKLCFHEINGPDRNTIASTWARPHLANARLIAAAPELLAAAILGAETIDNILSAHEGQSEYAQLREAFDALQAAIAKAEGRS